MFPSNENNSQKYGSAFQAPKKTHRIVCFLCHFFLLHFSQFTAVNLFIWAQDPWHDHSLVLRSEDQGIWGGKNRLKSCSFWAPSRWCLWCRWLHLPSKQYPPWMLEASQQKMSWRSGVLKKTREKAEWEASSAKLSGRARKTQGFFCRWRCLDKVSVYFRWLNLCRIMW